MKFSEKCEKAILKICPKFLKDLANKLVSKLPEKQANWLKNNKFFSICIAYSIRGLFFRPTMWPIYAAIAAYFGFKN
jgi:hypothetical protein